MHWSSIIFLGLSQSWNKFKIPASRQEPLPSHSLLYPPSHRFHNKHHTSHHSLNYRSHANPSHKMHSTRSLHSVYSSSFKKRNHHHYSSALTVNHTTTTVDPVKKSDGIFGHRSSRDEHKAERRGHKSDIGHLDQARFIDLRSETSIPFNRPVIVDIKQNYNRYMRRRWSGTSDTSRRDSKNQDPNPESVSSTVESTKTEVYGNGWLNLTNVGKGERGWYQCVSQHAFGNFSSNSVFINVQREFTRIIN